MLQIFRGFDAGDWVAGLALMLSLLVLYLEHLRPFKPHVRSSGRISLSKNPFDLSEGCVLFDGIFVNRGAQAGTIENVALTVRSTGFDALYVAHVEFASREIPLGEQIGVPALVTFTAFNIEKRSSIPKRILLRDVRGNRSLAEGRHVAEIWLLSTASNAWKSAGYITFQVSSADNTVLASITATLQPDGRYYVNWQTRDNVTNEWQRSVDKLETSVFGGKSTAAS